MGTMGTNRNSPTLQLGVQNGTATLENELAASISSEHMRTLRPSSANPEHQIHHLTAVHTWIQQTHAQKSSQQQYLGEPKPETTQMPTNSRMIHQLGGIHTTECHMAMRVHTIYIRMKPMIRREQG